MSRAARERVQSLSSWHDEWRELRVGVLGLGVTGFSVADTLAELGARVRVYSDRPDPERSRLLDVIGAEHSGARDIAAQLDDLRDFAPDLLVASPGLRPDHPLTQWAEGADVTVWGDIELGWRLRDKTGRIADWICVTGTNGKTTTAQLTAHMLVEAGLRAAPVGNIGVPILDALRDPRGYDALVVELSSFQLHRVQTISPYASVCLNLAADHWDWHGGAAAYRDAKARVYARTQVACVYNRADSETEAMVEEADVVEGARAVSFGLDSPPPSGFGVVEEVLVDRGYHASRRTEAFEIATLPELAEREMAAPHLVQNILAAAALARSRGAEPDDVARAVLNFRPDSHRAQTVGRMRGVVWVDDSKATNAHAADASLRAHERVVWVVGGLLKGVDLEPLVAEHAPRLRGAVVIGAEQSAVLAALGRHAPDVPRIAIDPRHTGETMVRAVRAAASLATKGDTVVLAPAAASMDQFTDYADRGRQFQAAVAALGEGGADDDDAASADRVG